MIVPPSSAALNAASVSTAPVPGPASIAELMLADGALKLDWEDELIAKTCLTHDGAIKHEPTKQAIEGAAS